MKNHFLLFVLMLLPVIASADVVEIDGVKYELNATEGTASVVSGNYSGELVIPSSVKFENNSYAVTSIGAKAFYGRSSLTSISIPNSVNSIGTGAFEGCLYLNAVYITDLNAWCNIKFEEFNSNPCCCANHLFLNGVEIVDLDIPSSVTSIREYTFHGCSSLKSVSIPNSVTSIGNSAFHGCSSLKSVSIPNSVTSIGNSAFYDCHSLTSISIPNSVSYIGYSTFSNCI